MFITFLLYLIYLIVVLFMHLFDWLFAVFVVHCLCMWVLFHFIFNEVLLLIKKRKENNYEWGSLDDRSFLPNVVYLEKAKSPYFWGKGISLATSQISLFKNVVWVDLQFLYPLHDYVYGLFRWFTFPLFRFLFFIFYILNALFLLVFLPFFCIHPCNRIVLF